MKALSIVGSSRNNGEREVNDFYPTPKYAVKELLKLEPFTDSFFEPACGEGDISQAILEYGYKNVYSSDLINRGYGDVIDFFKYEGKAFDNIITNPPYKCAQEFVERSKMFATNKIAMLLKTTFLESVSRYKFFKDTNFPLKCIYQFSKRLTLYKNGEKMKNSGMISYAWFVWDKNYSGKPFIEWICENDENTLF